MYKSSHSVTVSTVSSSSSRSTHQSGHVVLHCWLTIGMMLKMV